MNKKSLLIGIILISLLIVGGCIPSEEKEQIINNIKDKYISIEGYKVMSGYCKKEICVCHMDAMKKPDMMRSISIDGKCAENFFDSGKITYDEIYDSNDIYEYYDYKGNYCKYLLPYNIGEEELSKNFGREGGRFITLLQHEKTEIEFVKTEDDVQGNTIYVLDFVIPQNLDLKDPKDIVIEDNFKNYAKIRIYFKSDGLLPTKEIDYFTNGEIITKIIEFSEEVSQNYFVPAKEFVVKDSDCQVRGFYHDESWWQFVDNKFVQTFEDCTESDDGMDIYAKGTTSGLDTNGNVVTSSDDYCYSDTEVYEYYCDESSNAIKTQITQCKSNVCSDGACTA